MKGLAIASFVLGIIDPLFSSYLGLGLLPSILSEISRPMAISGLVLGLLGTLISIVFPSLKPEDITKQIMGNIMKQGITHQTIEEKKPKEQINEKFSEITSLPKKIKKDLETPKEKLTNTTKEQPFNSSPIQFLSQDPKEFRGSEDVNKKEGRMKDSLYK